MVDPLQVLLASVPVALGSTTITKEEDQLLGVGNVTTTDVAAGPPLIKLRTPQVMPHPMKRMMLSSLLKMWVTTWKISNLPVLNCLNPSTTQTYPQLLTAYGILTLLALLIL